MSPYIMWGVRRLEPWRSGRLANAFPTNPVAFPVAHSCDDTIRSYWDMYTYQIKLASKDWPRALAVQGSRHHRYDIDYDIWGNDIDYDIMTMIS
jgi:hypothetical protein